ncbi:hypothetical protein F4680DRAFT_413608 [Xylaria scruposa]|nr:hypothetical protein F4680DRAFT_413608 [Xylaria scruposa]
MRFLLLETNVFVSLFKVCYAVYVFQTRKHSKRGRAQELQNEYVLPLRTPTTVPRKISNTGWHHTVERLYTTNIRPCPSDERHEVKVKLFRSHRDDRPSPLRFYFWACFRMRDDPFDL